MVTTSSSFLVHYACMQACKGSLLCHRDYLVSHIYTHNKGIVISMHFVCFTNSTGNSLVKLYTPQWETEPIVTGASCLIKACNCMGGHAGAII